MNLGTNEFLQDQIIRGNDSNSWVNNLTTLLQKIQCKKKRNDQNKRKQTKQKKRPIHSFVCV